MAERFPADARIAVIAGGGSLPEAVVEHLTVHKRLFDVIALEGEAKAGFGDMRFSIGNVEGILHALERLGTTHVVLVGWVRRRPTLRDSRVGHRAIRALLPLLAALGKGDDAILREAIGAIERRGVHVIGVQDIWPELVAEDATLTVRKPTRAELDAARHGLDAAHAIGAFDTGQALVTFGKRIVALEGAEGTDGMLDRVARLRDEGRIRVNAGTGILVKACKPNQETRVDLPSIGPETVQSVERAALAGIIIEAGRSLILDRQRTIQAANDANVFIRGLSRNGV